MTLKRIMSTALAAVMATSVMSIGMVSSAYATPRVSTYNCSTDGVTSEYFTIGKSDGGAVSTSNTKFPADATYKFEGDEQSVSATNAIKMESKTIVDFEVIGTAKLEIAWSPSAADTTDSLILETTSSSAFTKQTLSTSDYTKITVTSVNDIPAGKYRISRGTGESRLYGLKLTDEMPEGTEEYTIKGTAEVPDDTKLTVDGTEVTVKTNVWSFTKFSATKPYEDNASVKITSPDYLDTTATLSYEDASKTYTANGAVYTPWTLEPIEAGQYTAAEISAGHDTRYFDLRNATGISSSEVKPKGGEYILFDLKEDNAVVTVEYKAGSTTDGRVASLDLTNGSKTVKGQNSTVAESTAPTVTLEADNLVKGECKLTAVSEDTSTHITKINIDYPIKGSTAGTSESTTDKPAVLKNSGKYYAVVLVTADQASKVSQITVEGMDKAITEVYQSVSLGSLGSKTAADFGAGSGDYLYASEVTGAVDNKTLQDIQNAIKISYTGVE